MSEAKHDLLVVTGPTACGKTRLGVALARALGGEIISADSRQVYRGLTIGTGKDLADFGQGDDRIPYHLIDVADPHEEYNVYRFQQDFYAVAADLRQRGRLPVMVGGTGLYVEAVVLGYRLVEAPEDPDLRAELATLDLAALGERLLSLKPRHHNVTDLQLRDRLIRAIEVACWKQRCPPGPPPAVHPLVLGAKFERELIYQRIEQRLAERLQQGMIEEVQGLIDDGLSHTRLESLGLEYRFISRFLRGEILDREQLQAQLAQAIRNFARRQLSWFRRMERRGVEIHWIEQAEPSQALELVNRIGRFEQFGTSES